MWIRVQSLSLFAYHGVYDEERKMGNHFEVDVEIRVPDSYGADDYLDSTVDYSKIFSVVANVSNATRYSLLERFCEVICISVLALDEAIAEVIVRVRKLAPPADVAVKSVEVERRMIRRTS